MQRSNAAISAGIGITLNPAERPEMLSELKGFFSRSAVYGVGDILIKAIAFFLLPLYTRVLSPSDYGILAITTIISTILGIVSSLSLHSYVSPLYFSTTDPQKRKDGMGTLFVAVIAIGGVIVLLLNLSGPYIFPVIFQDVPFEPYIRLAIWTMYFTSWGSIPLRVLQTQERSQTYVFLSLSASLLQVIMPLWFVLYLRQGIYGMLFGQLLAAIIMLIPYSIFIIRNFKLSFRFTILKPALIYSYPLIPHLLSQWILTLSDRAILQWYVPLDQLGLYSFSYTIGMIISVIATSMNKAWVPFLFRLDSSEGTAASQRVGQYGTYLALVLCLVSLGLSLFAHPFLIILTPPQYHAADSLIGWVAAGILLSTLYYYPVNFLFLRGKTSIVPQITVIAAITNIILNLLLIPRFGTIAAAWTTFFSYGIMLVLAWRYSFKVYPVVYEYRRLAILAGVTTTLWVLGSELPRVEIWLELLSKTCVLLLFPLLLIVLHFFSDNEKRALNTFISSLKHRTSGSAN